MQTLALALERAWYEPPRLLWLLYPLELLFAAVTAGRRALFRRGLLASGHPGCPVIVVGNISAGGTGKTPVVIALAKALSGRGLRVGVVSRGYGGVARDVQRVDDTSDARVVGDEAVLLAASVSGSVFVGRDRLAAARAARRAGAEVIVSDDGLQHYRLRRDVEVATLDPGAGLGNGHLLPVGPLREGPWRLETVDFVLERGGSRADRRTTYRPTVLRSLATGETRPAARSGLGPEVHALAAIARPARFFDTLRGLGLRVTEHPLRDHEAPSADLLTALRDRPLVITAKDATKVPPGGHPDAWVLEMELGLPAGFVDALLERLSPRAVPAP